MPQKSKATDLWASFQKALTQKPEKRPQGTGWMTLEELMAKFKKGEGAVRAALRMTKTERFRGYISRNGKLSQQVWYRPL